MIDSGPGRDAIAALLDFHVAAGVDLALDETPHDRLAEGAASPARPAPSGERPAARFAPPARPAEPMGTEAAREAPVAAASADALDEALAALARSRGAGRRIVPAAVPAGAPVLLVGGVPSPEDDMAGRPFAGRAGLLLDAMLAAIGLSRETVGLAYVAPWPSAARTGAGEVEAAAPLLLRRVELARPAALVAFGPLATAAILGPAGDFLRLRGRWGERIVGDRAVPVMPMLEPARLLKRPLDKRTAWADLRALRRVLDGEPARPGPT